MQHLEVSGAVRPLKWSLGVKWLIFSLSDNGQLAKRNILMWNKLNSSQNLQRNKPLMTS